MEWLTCHNLKNEQKAFLSLLLSSLSTCPKVYHGDLWLAWTVV